MLSGDACRALIVAGGSAGPTVTEVEVGPLEPPGPLQFSVYVTEPVASIGPTDWPELEVLTCPGHVSVPPVAVQVVALAVVHASVVDSPDCTELGEALRLVMDAGAVLWSTATVMSLVALVPPGPVQTSVYVSAAGVLSGPIVTPLLDVACVLPLHPSAPEPPLAVHDVAPVVAQASTIDCPAEAVVGVAVNVLIDAGGVGCVAPELTVNVVDTFPLLPPAPVQINVYV